MPESAVINYVEALKLMGIECSVLEHPPLKTIKDVLNFLNLTFKDCLPTLIMKGDDQYFALIFRGDCRVDFKKIKKELHIQNLCMATTDEFTTLTGLQPGAARVFNPDFKTVIDHKVFDCEYLVGGSGSFSCSIRYKTQDLKKIPNHIEMDLTE